MGLVDEAEADGTEGMGCCSTGSDRTRFPTSDKASYSPLPLSGSGEVEEERGVVEEVVEDGEWEEVSEEVAGG